MKSLFRGTDLFFINEGLFIWGCDIVGDIGYEHPTIRLAYLTHLAGNTTGYQVPSIFFPKNQKRCVGQPKQFDCLFYGENNGSREFSRKPVH